MGKSKFKPSCLLKPIIEQFDLNLEGLEIYTEAASGAYILNPILAALAGAKKVYAQTRDSHFMSAKEVAENVVLEAIRYGVADKIEVFCQRDYSRLATSDIITNSGFVRPIDRMLIDALKSTAVIPLMWETWEYRPEDFDLDFCKKKGILVLGTNEQEPPCDMGDFIGYSALKLMFELGYDGGRVLILGSPPLPSKPIVSMLRKINIDVTWASDSSDSDILYDELSDYFVKNGHKYDLLLLAEHEKPYLLFGENGLIDATKVKQINPSLKVAHYCGNIDNQTVKDSGLDYLPKKLAPFGFISYQPYLLGPRPVVTLFGAGLKVGQSMANARLSGKSISESARISLLESPAMDFKENLAWL
jgi:hypothetical protein